MEFKLRENIKIILFLITFTVALTCILFNIKVVYPVIVGVWKVFSPFLLGFALAFILHIPMNFFEEKLFKKLKLKKNVKRFLSFLITIIIVIGLITLTIFVVVPELKNTVMDLTEKFPKLAKNTEKIINEKLYDRPELAIYLEKIEEKTTNINEEVVNFLSKRALKWANSTFYFASSIVGGLISLAIALVFSIYILFGKEELVSQTKSLILAYTKEERAERIFYIGRLSSTIFTNFLSGQVLEAVIIGLMFLVTMLIFKFPYALAISMLIGLTAIIPLVGSFIGLAVGVFMIMVISLKKAILFLVMFLVIQQIEGNLIYPKVVGKASGLPSIWVLVAVTVGGNLMGILGILIFIPISAIIYSLLREDVHKKLNEKAIDIGGEKR